MRANAKVVLVVVGVLLLASGGVYGWLTQTPDPGPAYEPREANTEVHVALLDAGISEAAVDVTPERVLVRYELPEDMGMNQSIVIAAVETADTDPGPDRIVLQVYDDGEPVTQATVETERVHAYRSHQIEFESFWDSIEFRSAT